MGAICGFYNMNGETAAKEKGMRLMDKLNIYKFDKTDALEKGSVFMGCNIQINTPESKNEILPYYDIDSGCCITADAIIDNREELFGMLGIKNRKEITDSQLILAAYKSYGKACCDYLVGDFAFVIWNSREKELFCVRDHVGKRSLYYYASDKTFIFCTVIKPILELIEEKPGLNEKWISDFLSIEGVIHEIAIDETVYKNIYQVPPGHYIVVNEERVKVQKYWFPERIKTIRLKSDQEYVDTFRRIYEEAVKCRLRCEGNIGVMLSSGLDSTSVAAVAANELKKNNKSLEAFTSLPIIDYKEYLPKSQLADESKFINEFTKIYNNINLNYSRCEGKNSITNIDEFIEILEQPYKIIDNLFWVDEILSMAENKNCRVLLDGQFGNFTISYGNFITYIYTLVKRNKWITIYKEINSYCEFYKISRRLVVKALTKKLIKSIKLIEFVFSKKKPIELSFSIANPSMSNKWNSIKRAQKLGYNARPNKIYNFKDGKNFITNLVLFSHIGGIETKLSLARGIAKRDPSRDKRVVETCLSFPIEQFVKDGRERILIRRAMEGIVPDNIRLNYRVRGKQSADWVQRLYPHWAAVSDEILDVLKDEDMNRYLDTDKLKDMFNSVGTDLSKETYGFKLKPLIFSIVFNRFIKKAGQQL